MSTLNVFDVVADFGADPSGATTSSAAFQNAVNAAQSNPGIIWVPPGNYKAEGISQTSQFGGIIGAGRAETVIRTVTASGTMFSVTNTFLARIKDVTLGGTGGVQTGGALIQANRSHAGDYSDLEIVDCYNGIVLDDSTNCRVENNKGYNCYGPSLIDVRNGGAAHIDKNQFDLSNFGPSPYVYGAPVTVWAHSTVYAAGAVAIANNAYFIAGNAGTSAANGAGPAMAKFGTAVLDNNINWYFLCASFFHQVAITNVANSNFITSNDMDGPSAGPIMLDHSSCNIITGNTLSNGLRSAIDLYNASSDNIIANNVVQNFPLQGIAENTADCLRNIITPNNVFNVTYDDIKIRGTGGIYSPNVTH